MEIVFLITMKFIRIQETRWLLGDGRSVTWALMLMMALMDRSGGIFLVKHIFKVVLNTI